MFSLPKIHTDKFKQAGKIAKVGIFEYEIATQELFWSDGIRVMTETEMNVTPNLPQVFSLLQGTRNKYLLRNAFTKAISKGIMMNVDLEIRTPKGNQKFVWCIGEVELKNGVPTKIYGIAQDITTRKLLEKDLKTQNQQLQFAEKTVAIGYWKWTLETDEVIWSKNLYTIFDVAPGTPLKFNDAVAKVHPDDVTHVEQCTHQIVTTGQFNKFNYRIVLDDGTVKHIELQGHTTVDKNNKITQLVGTAQDISSQIAKETELFQKNYQLNKAEKMARIGHWTWNLDEDIALWSDNLYDIYGVERDTTISLDKFTSFIAEEDKARVNQVIETAIKTKVFKDIVYTINLESGETKIIKTVGEVKVIANNRVVEMIGTCQDITEQVSKEKLLIQKNHQLNLAEEMAIVGHWSWFPSINRVTWSNNLYKIYEHELGTPISYDTYIGYVHPQDKKAVSDKIRKAFDTGIFEKQVYRIQLKSGTIKTIRSVGKVIFDEDGNVTEMLGTCQDISEQVVQEQELVRKNNYLTFAERLTKIGYYQWDTVTHDILWSDNLYTIFEHEKGAPITFETYYNYIHEDDRDYVQKQVELGYAGKKHHDVLHRITLQNGSVKNIRLIAVGRYNNNELVEVNGTLQDVTEQVQREQELILKNELLNRAEQASSVGYWRMQAEKGGAVDLSDNYYRILGFELGTPMEFDTLLTLVLPEDRSIVIDAKKAIFKEKHFPKHAYRIKTPGGVVKNIVSEGSLILDEEGQIEDIIGTIKDVTQELEAELRFKDLLASTPDALLIANEAGEIQLVNKQAELFFGYSEKELKEFIVVDLVAKGYKRKSVAYYEEFFRNPQNITLTDFDDLHLINRRGDRIPATVTLGPFKTNNEVLAIITLKDITLQKQQEAELLTANTELKASSEKLKEQNRQLEDFTHITSHNLRSPVNNLNTLIKFYNETDEQEEKDVLFDKVTIVANHLNDTLNTLIECLMIKSDTNIERQQLDLNAVLQKTKELLAAEIKKTGAVIQADFKAISTVVYNDIYLESIFLNLIGNAIKYRSPERSPIINVSTKWEQNSAFLYFNDNGLGIDLQKHGHKVFGLHKVFHKNPEARGIGLYMTKAQIEAMGGSITIKSEVNQGTTFKIDLNLSLDV
ncbi:PAS domain-containing protein [Flavobacterium sp. ASW18X]|uniref:PAS domain-containing sensor histidine kinase n=1 Tax=Flavobacterium sp. ASW18X TaxID=2572595 RepID=UPI0010AE5717|nr:PAS domain-containing protein [Flavobacterium sp. ASW18X]TKD59307.1 PAS domain S-box protein [Flavobacterium sp. ASW18X]